MRKLTHSSSPLGYKGVLAVDPQLSGERICFRPEMRKFKPLICPYCREGNLDFCPHENDQNLHIADMFDSPKRAYLTRYVPWPSL